MRRNHLSVLLVIATTLGCVAVAEVGTSFGAEQAAADFDVSAYDLTVDYQPDSQQLRGVAQISGTATGPLERLAFSLKGPTARSVTVDGNPAKSFAQNGTEELVIVPPKTVDQGAQLKVQIQYDGKPGNGWFRTATGGATTFEGATGTWFPTHRENNDKADFHLAATVPAGWSVVSIGREQLAPTGTFRWTEPDVDPRHISVSVDRFTIDRSRLADGTPVVNAYENGLEEATRPLAKRLPDVLTFLSGKFGDYPFKAAGNVFVQVDDDAPATAPETRPVFLGAGNARYMDLDAVVHEQAHQWYGVSVAASREEDQCLSECWATYASWLWDEAIDVADLDTRYREQVSARKGDADFWQELYRPGRAPGINEYTKGPLALHALRRQVGDEAFRRLMKQWPQEHRGSYVDWPQFEAFTQKVTGQDLTGFFQAWFRGATVPADQYLWPGALKGQR